MMAGIVGAAGLEPTLAAIRKGRIVAFANKEVLVCAGSLFMREVQAHGATLLPVDSEHNAIWQCFDFERVHGIEKITLTCSGGPFRERSLAEMRDMTPEQAVAHPTWRMGAKISVDSATLMNKGLELIEAHHLFQLEPERIDIVVHPQSIVHGLVTYRDGSVLAHLGSPDMRTPIAYALGWPDRTPAPTTRPMKPPSTPSSGARSGSSTSPPPSSAPWSCYPAVTLIHSTMFTIWIRLRAPLQHGYSPSAPRRAWPNRRKRDELSDTVSARRSFLRRHLSDRADGPRLRS
jgi:hypothetical protein